MGKPVTILAAFNCTCSNLLDSAWLHPSHTSLAYSKLTYRHLTLAEKNTAKPKVRQTNPGEPETRQGGGTTAGVEHKNFIQALPSTNQCTNRDLLPDQGPRRHTRDWRANEQRNSYLAFFLTALEILYRCWPFRSSPLPVSGGNPIR